MRLVLLILIVLSSDLLAFPLAKETIKDFVEELKIYPQLDLEKIDSSLQNIKISEKIIALMSSPPEKTKTWDQYRSLLVGEQRIRQGCRFLRKNKEIFREADTRYGVPASIIASIIGVETYYGKIKGNHDVLTALATLAFHYPLDNPKEKKFFVTSLKNFYLWLTDKGGILTVIEALMPVR